ncbi:MAG: hypothetical protein IKJ99_04955 [Oscillospiraceae bacterium]|nr:hypothetical protein [Oscillospiraceae bacterium]
MREQLIQYVNLLFAGAPDSDDIRMEILQNTLDRYDDLIAQGKSPEAAYRLAVSGIGDISDLLNHSEPSPVYADPFRQAIHEEVEDIQSKKMRAVAIAMYILCAVPLFIFSEFGYETLGLCFTLLMVAAATALIIMSKKKSSEKHAEEPVLDSKKQRRKNISSVIWAAGLAVYFLLSILTGAWHLTWILFFVIKCVQGLAWAILDLKEAVNYEN